MSNYTKKILIPLLLVTSQIVVAAQHVVLTNYNEIMTALTQGDEVRAIMKLDKCSGDSNSAAVRGVVGGMSFTNFNKHHLIVAGEEKNVIATSINILIQHSVKGHVNNYVRLRLFEDNTVEIFSEMLEPKTYNQLSAATFHCKLSDGNDQNGVVLYDLST